MRYILKMLKCFQGFLLSVVFLVAFDMLVLGGKIKLWWIAVANTTDYSPFSTDGQSNWILILALFTVIILLYLIVKALSNKELKK